jgi:serine/threonine protein kinase
VGIVLELLEISLLELLHGTAEYKEYRTWHASFLSIASDVAKGVAYLHFNNLLHRDLKPGNVLLSDSWVAKVADFGSSAKGKPGSAAEGEGIHGTPPYMAPEVANSRPYCPKAEVFSFATVTYEIASRKKPFTNLLPDAFRKALSNGYVPEIPRKWPAELQSLISVCWKLDAQQRPEFREILPRLEALCAEHPQKRIQSL